MKTQQEEYIAVVLGTILIVVQYLNVTPNSKAIQIYNVHHTLLIPAVHVKCDKLIYRTRATKLIYSMKHTNNPL